MARWPEGQIAAVALGSNLGDRRAHLDYAVGRLRMLIDDLVVSGYIETDPVGVGAQPRYLNAAAVGRSRLAPRPLLDALLAIERDRGRERPFQGAPRTLDLDLVLYGNVVRQEADLELPHPRFRERRFVLEPLAAVAPDLVDPVTGATIRELLDRLRRPEARGRGPGAGGQSPS
jgi:2-amino-4-hydroxy-6-hydroxymethyldihydropteridine diphosphokinase